MSFENPDLHIFQETSGWVPADYCLYEFLDFLITTLCYSLQTLAIITSEGEKRIEKKLHITIFQEILHL